MSKPILIALTGKITSGKSYAARILEDCGFLIVDLDVLAREVVAPPSKTLDELVAGFGEEILNEDKTLDRARLAKRAFVNEDATKKLNDILHPAIQNAFMHIYKTSTAPRLAVEIPLPEKAPWLLELCSEIIYIRAPYEVRKARAMQERGMDEADFERRDALQAEDEVYEFYASAIFDNNTHTNDLEQALRTWLVKRGLCQG
ncbi:MAG: dephospho-CoA kinase [Coriobacteriia bacterium]|nr:dephospho-CoA kinase [Coriobacteriia bacterium]